MNINLDLNLVLNLLDEDRVHQPNVYLTIYKITNEFKTKTKLKIDLSVSSSLTRFSRSIARFSVKCNVCLNKIQ